MQVLIPLLHCLVRGIDAFTEFTGRLVSWLALLMMVVTCLVVFLRYALESSSMALQESVTYLHASLFMLGIAYTLKRGGHVRVDIFYRRFSARTQTVVDLLGSLLFLIPVAVLILLFSWDYVSASWAIVESSKEPNGLPWVYLLKSLLILMPLTLIIQGVAEVIRHLLVLSGHGNHQQPHQEEGML